MLARDVNNDIVSEGDFVECINEYPDEEFEVVGIWKAGSRVLLRLMAEDEEEFDTPAIETRLLV